VDFVPGTFMEGKMTDLAERRSQLTQLRAAHGFDSPTGRRCSNVLEMLEHWATAEGEQKVMLGKNIEKQIAEMEQIRTQTSQ